MKSPKKILALIPIFGICFLTTELSARIGESRQNITSRLTESGGLLIRDNEIIDERMRKMPYHEYMRFLENTAVVEIYYKTFDGSRPILSDITVKRSPPGWELHVIYMNGKSVLEAYSSSDKISEYETNQILALNSGGSRWERFDANAAATGTEGKVVSAFGFSMQRSDETVRANSSGKGGLMIFSAQLDTFLANAKQSNLQEDAPISTSGF
jgi:hypothetical protein